MLSLSRVVLAIPVTYLILVDGPVSWILGLILLAAIFTATLYYSVIVAWVLFSAWFAASAGFSGQTLEAYEIGLGAHGIQYAIALGVMLICLFVAHRGLRGGIETVNKFLVPLFGLGAMYLVFVSLNLEDAPARLATFLQPDFSQAGPSVWFAAMGQACFSVGLSGTLCVMYGSYLREETAVVPAAAATCLMDLGAAFLAALFVVPAALVFGLDLADGPDLLFKTLPNLFAVMPGGRLLAPLFLLGWAVVSMLTIIAVMDTVAGSLADLTGRRFKRRHWLWAAGAAACVLMLPVALNPHWIGILDTVVGSGMFQLGALLAVLAVGWGLGAAVLRPQIAIGMPRLLQPVLVWWIRLVVPVALALILGGFLYEKMVGA